MGKKKKVKKKKKKTAYIVSIQFLSDLYFLTGWTLWHSSSKNRAFAAVRKCTRSENPAPEMGTLLVYWSVPYKILTKCTLIIDIKRCQHTYIHTSVWHEKKRNMEQMEETVHPCPIHHVHPTSEKSSKVLWSVQMLSTKTFTYILFNGGILHQRRLEIIGLINHGWLHIAVNTSCTILFQTSQRICWWRSPWNKT